MRRRLLVVIGSWSSLALVVGCGAIIGDLTERDEGGHADPYVDGPTTTANGVVRAPEAGRDGATILDAATLLDSGEGGSPDAGCPAEPLATTCAGRACGPATNNCGTDVICPDTCAEGLVCGSGGANTCGPASCVGTGAGVASCSGTDGGTCCESILVLGGTYDRTTGANPATVSSFRLDKYEISVGRFRKFVTAVLAGYRPAPGSGRHRHLPNGGLNSGEEVGWNALDWNGFLTRTRIEWDQALSGSDGTWTLTPGPNEDKPQNRASWYELYAFCIWDGGFFPSEAEWQYAASGAGQRAYPWGQNSPGANADLANWGCYFNGTGACSGSSNIAAVGAIPAGNSLYGHAEMAGNLYEWVLDGQAPYATCNDCAILPPGSPGVRVMRGGSYAGDFQLLSTTSRNIENPSGRSGQIGARCARKP